MPNISILSIKGIWEDHLGVRLSIDACRDWMAQVVRDAMPSEGWD